MSSDDDRIADEWDEAPYVCPGCYAVGGEPCAGYCPDAAIERANDHRDCLLDEVDDLLYQPDTEPAPDDGGDDVTQSIAILEAALAQSKLDQPGPLPLWLQNMPGRDELLPRIVELESALVVTLDHPGARCCIWCRELVLDDFDHDFCEPEEPTEVMDRRQAFHTELGIAPRAAEVVRDEVLCSGCGSWLAVEVTEPPQGTERGVLSSQRLDCRCGMAIYVTFSWARRIFVGVKYERKKVMN